MTTRGKVELAIGIMALLACVIIGRSWLAEHDARLKAETAIDQQQKAFQVSADQMKQLQAAQKDRDALTASAIAKLADAAAAQKTPQQITNWIPGQFASAPEPIKASIAPATAQNPTPPAVITVPQADLSYLRDQVSSCQKNAMALSGAQQDLSSCQAQAKLAQQQLAAVEAERDALKQELKGGTVWQRLKGGAKKVLIGAAIGAAAMCTSGHCK